MTKRPRVVVCGWYGASNIGDELLLGVVHAWVRELGGELTIVSLNPEHTARTYATAAVDFLNLGDIARALADSDLFVMGGAVSSRITIRLTSTRFTIRSPRTSLSMRGPSTWLASSGSGP